MRVLKVHEELKEVVENTTLSPYLCTKSHAHFMSLSICTVCIPIHFD